MIDWRERITADPRILVGKPVIKGTRISVELILELLAGGWTEAEVLENYPSLVADDLRACLAYAAELVKEERGLPVQA